MRCCVVLAALLVCALATSHTTPLFAWSGSQLLRAQPGRQSLSPFSLSDFTSCLVSSTPLGYRRPCALLEPQAAPAEIQLVFLTPELSITSIAQLAGAYNEHPNGGALANLERFQEKAASAVAVPYASLGNDASLLMSALTALIRYDLPSSATVVLAAADSASPLARLSQHVCSVADLPALLSSHPELFANGVADLVIVQLGGGSADAVGADDALMGSIVDAVALASAGNYLAMFTGLTASLPASLPTQPRAHVARDAFESELLFESNNATGNRTCNATLGECDNHGYWPPEVLAAVIAGGLLAAVLLGAVHMTADVQTPERFETPVKGHGQQK